MLCMYVPVADDKMQQDREERCNTMLRHTANKQLKYS